MHVCNAEYALIRICVLLCTHVAAVVVRPMLAEVIRDFEKVQDLDSLNKAQLLQVLCDHAVCCAYSNHASLLPVLPLCLHIRGHLRLSTL